jgi:hypothetical protein
MDFTNSSTDILLRRILLIRSISASSKSNSGLSVPVFKILNFSSSVNESQSISSISPFSFSNLIFLESEIPLVLRYLSNADSNSDSLTSSVTCESSSSSSSSSSSFSFSNCEKLSVGSLT